MAPYTWAHITQGRNVGGRGAGRPPIHSVFVSARLTKDGNQDRDARGLGDGWTPNGEPSCGRNWTPIRMRVGARNVGGVPMGCRKLGGHLTVRWRWTGAGVVAAPNREWWTARWAGVDVDGGAEWRPNVGGQMDGGGRGTWSHVDADRGSPGGRGWRPNMGGQVVGGGRRTWSQVGADRGSGWAPDIGLELDAQHAVGVGAVGQA